jgi:hypothetical protein
MTLYVPALVISHAHITHGQSVRHSRTVRGQWTDSLKLLSSHPEALRDFAIYTDGSWIPNGQFMPPFLCQLEKLQFFFADLVYQLGSLLKIILNTSTNTIESIITIVNMSWTWTKILSHQDEDVHLWPYVPWLILHFSYQSSSISHSHI